MEIEVSRRVFDKHPGIHIWAKKTKVTVNTGHDLQPALKNLAKSLPSNKDVLKDLPVVRAFRDFYWQIGIDPTKQRPAGEALARRFLSTHSLPTINSVVDAGNIVSAETFIPIGIYDTRSLSGKLLLRFAEEGELFTDITGSSRKLTNSEVILADDEGPVHIFPHRDSQRTMVKPSTKEVLIVGCGVKGVEPSHTRVAVERVIELLVTLMNPAR